MKSDGKKLGIGIVGLGVISDIHIEALHHIEEAKLKAVCTRNMEKAKAVASDENCKWYTDYRNLADDSEIDIVILCTPSGSRLEMVKYIAGKKKHIITEKPIEVTVERIDEMLRVCEENGVYIASIFHKRYHPVYKWIKNAIDTGKFGDIVTTDVLMKWYRPPDYYDNSEWRGTMSLDGGGALMNQCVHFIDMVQWFNGGMKSVFAKTGKKVHKHIEVEDTAVAVVEYENGALGVIEATTSAYPGFSTLITVNGSKGGVVCENEQIRELKLLDETDEDKKIMKNSGFGEHGGDAKTNVKKDFSLHLEQLKEIMDAILSGRQPPVKGFEARKAVEIIMAMYKSADENRPIALEKSNVRAMS